MNVTAIGDLAAALKNCQAGHNPVHTCGVPETCERLDPRPPCPSAWGDDGSCTCVD